MTTSEVSTAADISGSAVVVDGSWHDVVFTFNGYAAHWYVDGALDGSITAFGTVKAAGSVWYGCLPADQDTVPESTLRGLQLFDITLEAALVTEMYAKYPATIATECGDGWYKHGAHCWQVSDAQYNKTAAEDLCVSLGSSLAIVGSLQENNFIWSLLRPETDAWIATNFSNTNFTNWPTTQSVPRGACTALRKKENQEGNGFWIDSVNTSWCSSHGSAVCQKKSHAQNAWPGQKSSYCKRIHLDGACLEGSTYLGKTDTESECENLLRMHNALFGYWESPLQTGQNHCNFKHARNCYIASCCDSITLKGHASAVYACGAAAVYGEHRESKCPAQALTSTNQRTTASNTRRLLNIANITTSESASIDTSDLAALELLHFGTTIAKQSGSTMWSSCADRWCSSGNSDESYQILPKTQIEPSCSKAEDAGLLGVMNSWEACLGALKGRPELNYAYYQPTNQQCTACQLEGNRSFYKLQSGVTSFQQTDNQAVPEDSSVSGPLLSRDESKIFVTIGQKIVVFNSSDGQQVSQSPDMEFYLTDRPTATEDGQAMFVSGKEGKVFAFAGVGAPLWQSSQLGVSMNGAPIMSFNQKQIFAAAAMETDTGDDGKVFALDAADGLTAWSTQGVGEKFTGSPVLSRDGQVLYVAGKSGKIYSYSATDGSAQWQSTHVGTKIIGSPKLSVDGQYVFVAIDTKVVAFKCQDGTKAWETESLGHEIAQSPAVGHDGAVLVVVNVAGAVSAFSSSKGAKIWGPEATAGRPAVPTFSSNSLVVFVGCEQFLFAFSTADGTQLWKSDSLDWSVATGAAHAPYFVGEVAVKQRGRAVYGTMVGAGVIEVGFIAPKLTHNSIAPTRMPTAAPTASPSAAPTPLPTATPSGAPTGVPSASPLTSGPTPFPTTVSPTTFTTSGAPTSTIEDQSGQESAASTVGASQAAKVAAATLALAMAKEDTVTAAAAHTEAQEKASAVTRELTDLQDSCDQTVDSSCEAQLAAGQNKQQKASQTEIQAAASLTDAQAAEKVADHALAQLEADTDASTLVDPTAAPTTGAGCTNIESPDMVAGSQSCAKGIWYIQNKCNLDSLWIHNKFCQQSCFDHGNGYDGDQCNTNAPSGAPITISPSNAPTSATLAPSVAPTTGPVTLTPTSKGESFTPSVAPSTAPLTFAPTGVGDTLTLTDSPTTDTPTQAPTFPTASPTASPTALPTTSTPTFTPTMAPTFTPTPSDPSFAPTFAPTSAPSHAPTPVPPIECSASISNQLVTSSMELCAGPEGVAVSYVGSPCGNGQSILWSSLEVQPMGRAHEKWFGKDCGAFEPTQNLAENLELTCPCASLNVNSVNPNAVAPTLTLSSSDKASFSRLGRRLQANQDPTPTANPTAPSHAPTLAPTATPTLAPSGAPSNSPSESPSVGPTTAPTFQPSNSPTFQPSASPTTETYARCAPVCEGAFTNSTISQTNAAKACRVLSTAGCELAATVARTWVAANEDQAWRDAFSGRWSRLVICASVCLRASVLACISVCMHQCLCEWVFL